MVVWDELGEKIFAWALKQPEIDAVILIGSRARSHGESQADRLSDWDFQIITRNHAIFGNPDWVDSTGLGRPRVYSIKEGRLGSSDKVTAVFDCGIVDLVLIPFAAATSAKQGLLQQDIDLSPVLQKAILDLAVILKPGFEILKGKAEWANFFENVRSTKIPLFSEREIVELANAFACDYISTKRKIERGEYLAAQRWLHFNLIEPAAILINEQRRRSGEAPVFDARRAEKLLSPEHQAIIAVNVKLSRESLLKATELLAVSFQTLVRALIDDRWKWPF